MEKCKGLLPSTFVAEFWDFSAVGGGEEVQEAEIVSEAVALKEMRRDLTMSLLPVPGQVLADRDDKSEIDRILLSRTPEDRHPSLSPKARPSLFSSMDPTQTRRRDEQTTSSHGFTGFVSSRLFMSKESLGSTNDTSLNAVRTFTSSRLDIGAPVPKDMSRIAAYSAAFGD